jgi:hypothetical protein
MEYLITLFLVGTLASLSKLIYVAFFKYSQEEIAYTNRKLINDRFH